MLTRESILAVCRDLPRALVEVPEWGGTVFVRTMTAGERDRFEVLSTDAKRRDFRATLTVFTVCDEEGKRLFAEADIPFLTELPFQALQRVVEAALELNKIDTEAVDAAKGKSVVNHSAAS